MKRKAKQQEILLVTNTTFTQKQCRTKEGSDKLPYLSPTDQLEKACWKGLLNQLLPEIVVRPTFGKQLLPWYIRNGKSFLQIDLSEFPLQVEKQFSIDTNLFLSKLCTN